MNDAVQNHPFTLRSSKTLNFFIAKQRRREAQLRAWRPQPAANSSTRPFQLFVLISESKFSAFTVHGGSNARSDGQFASDTNDRTRLPARKPHVLFLYQINRQPLAPKAASSNCCVYGCNCGSRFSVRSLVTLTVEKMICTAYRTDRCI